MQLDFQTGVAPKTLVFGYVRWVDWPEFTTPPLFGQITAAAAGQSVPLVKYESAIWTYNLGIGRQLTDRLAGAFSITYEPETGDTMPTLAPTTADHGNALAELRFRQVQYQRRHQLRSARRCRERLRHRLQRRIGLGRRRARLLQLLRRRILAPRGASRGPIRKWRYSEAIPACREIPRRRTKEAAAPRFLCRATHIAGRLDILVNNAAANPYYGHILDTDLVAYDKTADVNIRGYFFMSVAAGKMMKRQGGGAIVNVASVNGLQPATSREFTRSPRPRSST